MVRQRAVSLVMLLRHRSSLEVISMSKEDFRHWVRTTLQGHIVGIWIYFSCPIAAVFLFLNYQDGTLTVVWALFTVFAATVIGAVLGTVLFFVNRPRHND
jgi:hypothetical protein